MSIASACRRSRRLVVVALATLVLAHVAAGQTPAQPAGPIKPKPRGGAGGTYTGPGDTVPPPCTGPNCPTPPPPPFCEEPCYGDYASVDCWAPCSFTKSPTVLNWTVNWSGAPECMQGQVVRVYDITIQDLLNACSSVMQGTIANICIPLSCPTGIDAIFTYTTIPFQLYEDGVPTTDGSTLPICGLGYDLAISHDDGSCDDLGAWAGYLSNETLEGMGCDTSPFELKLQVDCICFEDLLWFYALTGYYNPLAPAYLTPGSVVFSILVKCCAPGGGSVCS